MLHKTFYINTKFDCENSRQSLDFKCGNQTTVFSSHFIGNAALIKDNIMDSKLVLFKDYILNHGMQINRLFQYPTETTKSVYRFFNNRNETKDFLALIEQHPELIPKYTKYSKKLVMDLQADYENKRMVTIFGVDDVEYKNIRNKQIFEEMIGFKDEVYKEFALQTTSLLDLKIMQNFIILFNQSKEKENISNTMTIKEWENKRYKKIARKNTKLYKVISEYEGKVVIPFVHFVTEEGKLLKLVPGIGHNTDHYLKCLVVDNNDSNSSNKTLIRYHIEKQRSVSSFVEDEEETLKNIIKYFEKQIKLSEPKLKHKMEEPTIDWKRIERNKIPTLCGKRTMNQRE